MKYLTIGLFLLVFNLSCNSKDELTKSKIEILEIPFEKVLDQINFSELIDTSVVIIPLKVDLTEGVFLNSINQIEFLENEIIVLDNFFNQTIQVFDRTGNFLRTIGSKGQAPGEYFQPMGFLVSQETLEVLDVGKILKYDRNGNFITSNRYDGFTSSQFQKLSEGYAIISSGADEDNLILTDVKLNLVSSHFPYHTRAINPILLNPIYKNEDGRVIYRRNLNDTLFNLSDLQNPEPFRVIDYGKKKVDLNQLLTSPNPEKTIQEEASKFANTLYFFENKEYYYLAFTLENEIWIMIKSVVSGKSFLFKNSNLTNDVIFDPYSYLIGVDDNTFYFLAKPDRIISSFLGERVPSLFNSHKTKMESLVKSLDQEDNPVLFGVKFNF